MAKHTPFLHRAAENAGLCPVVMGSTAFLLWLMLLAPKMVLAL